MGEPRFAVIVSFGIPPATRARFLDLVRANAATSIAEPGCRRFDIVETTDGVWLYEVYDDGAAFAAHLRSPHFRAFDSATQGLIQAKALVSGPVLESADP